MAERKRPPPPPAPKGQTYFLLLMMLMLLITVDPQLRGGLGAGMSVVLTPTIGFGGSLPVISVMLAGALTGLVSTGLRHWSSDYLAMERARLLQRSFTREMNDARLKRDPDRIHRLRSAQPFVMKETMETQMATMKPAVGTMFLAIAVFWWLSVFLDPLQGHVHIDAVSLPWAPAWPLHSVFGPFPYWMALYSIMSLPFTVAFGSALKLWEFRSFDPSKAGGVKPVPTIDDLLEKADESTAEEVVVEREVERARRRMRGKQRAVTAGPDDIEIVDPEEGATPSDEDDLEVVEVEARAALSTATPRIVGDGGGKRDDKEDE